MPTGSGTQVKAMTEARRMRVSELYLSGMRMSEIANVLTPEFPQRSGKPIAFQTISTDIKKLRAQWRAAGVVNMNTKIEMELAKLDQMEQEAWIAWERTIGKIKVRTTKSGGPNAGETTERVERSAGDPRFLSIIGDCVKKRCELLGLNAPTQTRIGNPDNSPINVIRVIEVGTTD
jgi:hypothetical protein